MAPLYFPKFFFQINYELITGNLKDEITLICAKFGANISKVTRCETKRLHFLPYRV